MSADKCGYDIESAVPDALGKGESSLRFIEVKGRTAGATSINMTFNEIRTALNQPEQFILAIVAVDGPHTRTIYLKKAFPQSPGFFGGKLEVQHCRSYRECGKDIRGIVSSMAQIKKLIEVALPLDAINAESAREKSIRHGHPSTLHLWWGATPAGGCARSALGFIGG